MFTNVFKSQSRFGPFIVTNNTDKTNLVHKDKAFARNGQTRYYNKNGCFGYTGGSISGSILSVASSSSNGWRALDREMLPDGIESYDAVGYQLTLITDSDRFLEDGSLRVQFSLYNSSQSAIEIKSLVYFTLIYLFTSETGTSTSSNYYPIIYYNLDRPITVEPAATVLLTFTFSNGDITSVSQG